MMDVLRTEVFYIKTKGAKPTSDAKSGSYLAWDG